MGTCYSAHIKAPDERYSETEERPFQAKSPSAEILAVQQPAAADCNAAETCRQPEDTSHYFQAVRLKALAVAGDSGIISCPGIIIGGSDASSRPVSVNIATRNYLSDEAVEKLQRLVGRAVHGGLARRLAFSIELLSTPSLLQQRSSSSKLLQSGAQGRSHGGTSEARSGRLVQWSSFPAISTAINSPNPVEHKDVSMCISGPCVPSSASLSVGASSRLAAQNADIAAAMAHLTTFDGHQLLGCIDELPDVHGNLLQIMQCIQNRRSTQELIDTLLLYALEVAQAVAALHRLGVHHGALTPVSVLMVPADDDTAAASAATTPPLPSSPAAAALSQPSSSATQPRSGVASSDGLQAAAAAVTALQALRCKLTLYGLVNPVEHASQLAFNAAGWGAVSYMAPECFKLEPADVTHEMLERVDTHAFGALCYHLFVGSAPYHQYHIAQVLLGHTVGGLQLVWPGPDGRRPPTPGPVRHLVARCLDRSPEARPSFPELVSELQSIRQQYQLERQQEQRRRQLLQQQLQEASRAAAL